MYTAINSAASQYPDSRIMHRTSLAFDVHGCVLLLLLLLLDASVDAPFAVRQEVGHRAKDADAPAGSARANEPGH